MSHRSRYRWDIFDSIKFCLSVCSSFCCFVNHNNKSHKPRIKERDKWISLTPSILSFVLGGKCSLQRSYRIPDKELVSTTVPDLVRENKAFSFAFSFLTSLPTACTTSYTTHVMYDTYSRHSSKILNPRVSSTAVFSWNFSHTVINLVLSSVSLSFLNPYRSS